MLQVPNCLVVTIYNLSETPLLSHPSHRRVADGHAPSSIGCLLLPCTPKSWSTARSSEGRTFRQHPSIPSWLPHTAWLCSEETPAHAAPTSSAAPRTRTISCPAACQDRNVGPGDPVASPRWASDPTSEVRPAGASPAPPMPPPRRTSRGVPPLLDKTWTWT